jgi:hypothetical protein
MNDIEHFNLLKKTGENIAFLSIPTWQPVGLEGNRLQKRLPGSYFAAFSTNRITIFLQNPQNLPSPSHFFATILQVRQAASPVNITLSITPRDNTPPSTWFPTWAMIGYS